MPLTIEVADVAEWLHVEETGIDAPSCQLAIDAVVHAAPLRYDPWKFHPDGLEPGGNPAWRDEVPDLWLGLVMQVAALRRRPDSPTGTISFDGFSSSIAAYDPDISRLTGPYEIVRFG